MSEKKKAGRRSRQEELRRAIETAGIDPALVDPFRILAAIAIDSRAAPTTKIEACVALIEHPPQPSNPADQPAPAAQPDPALDVLNQRAIQRMKDGK